jgi:hypothetical protein
LRSLEEDKDRTAKSLIDYSDRINLLSKELSARSPVILCSDVVQIIPPYPVPKSSSGQSLGDDHKENKAVQYITLPGLYASPDLEISYNDTLSKLQAANMEILSLQKSLEMSHLKEHEIVYENEVNLSELSSCRGTIDQQALEIAGLKEILESTRLELENARRSIEAHATNEAELWRLLDSSEDDRCKLEAQLQRQGQGQSEVDSSGKISTVRRKVTSNIGIDSEANDERLYQETRKVTKYTRKLNNAGSLGADDDSEGTGDDKDEVMGLLEDACIRLERDLGVAKAEITKLRGNLLSAGEYRLQLEGRLDNSEKALLLSRKKLKDLQKEVCFYE